MESKYMVSNTIKYSDGTETVISYDQNGSQVEIEQEVAEAIAETSPEAPIEEPSESEVSDAQPADETAE